MTYLVAFFVEGEGNLDVPEVRKRLIATIRELLSYVPSNNLEDPPRVAATDDVNRVDPDLDAFIPESPNQPYEMRDLIKTIADDAHFLEVHQDFARNLVVDRMRSAVARHETIGADDRVRVP